MGRTLVAGLHRWQAVIPASATIHMQNLSLVINLITCTVKPHCGIDDCSKICRVKPKLAQSHVQEYEQQRDTDDHHDCFHSSL